MTTVADDSVVRSVTAPSFDRFYEDQYVSVVRLAVVLTGRRDVAEELAQDGFLAAFDRWDDVGGFDDPGAWVRRVVTNRCVSSGRRHVTEQRLLARLRGRRLEADPPSAIDDELWALVRALPKRQAQVLALAFVEDRSVADIAEILGCGQETVRTHLRRGRLAVAERLGLLNNDGGGDDAD